MRIVETEPWFFRTKKRAHTSGRVDDVNYRGVILGLAEQKASALLRWGFLLDSLESQIKVGPLLAKWEEERYPIDIQLTKLAGVDVGASSSRQVSIKKTTTPLLSGPFTEKDTIL